MSTLVVERKDTGRGGFRKAERPKLKVIRVAAGPYFIGEIHLDGQDRVRRRADTVPSDIVLKVLVAHTRQGEVCGKLTGRKDGREFYWYVVGAEQTGEGDEAGALLEAVA